ncbi:MAG: hypothetical protein J7577_20150 [Sphingobacteriaceae bacterium]|nr:hypothetical protein [Sphingobacteriaceae bacterium]
MAKNYQLLTASLFGLYPIPMKNPIFSAALCRGGMALWSAKVPKALRQSAMSLLHNPMRIKKNSGTSFSVQYIFKIKSSL